MKKIILLSVFCGMMNLIPAQQTKKNPPTKKQSQFQKTKRDGVFEMKNYFLVFLKKGPNRSQDSLTAAKIQEEHLNHLAKMYNEGKMNMAGPLMDDGDIRGICVYNVATLEEVKKYTEMDPAVKAGRLIVEIHPWYAAKGSILK